MARSRTLKPDFWTDGRIVKMSPLARLFYQGTWNFALCDYGHLDDDADSLKLKILPADAVDPEELLAEIMAAGRIVRKQTPEGRSYLQVPTLAAHTKMDTRWTPRCPYCLAESTSNPTSAQPSTSNPAETRASSAEHTETHASKGKERKVKESTESARKRGTRIPDDFAVDAEMVAWARIKCPAVDGKWETEKFINHWQAESGARATKADWALAWKNWMLRAAEYAPSRASPARQPEHVPGYLGQQL